MNDRIKENAYNNYIGCEVNRIAGRYDEEPKKGYIYVCINPEAFFLKEFTFIPSEKIYNKYEERYIWTYPKLRHESGSGSLEIAVQVRGLYIHGFALVSIKGDLNE